jgi:hypothetical protein
MDASSFAGSKPLDPGRNYRAYADVHVKDATGAVKYKLLCLVDTGSDYSVLPTAAATAAAIALTGPAITFSTAGGVAYTLPSHPAVDLIVEGYAITVPVAFSASAAFTPLLGRLELVEAFDAGFDATNWYWG